MKTIKESVLVLKYPIVTPTPDKKLSKRQYITPELLEKHILWLLGWKYNPLSGDEFIKFLFAGEEIPYKSYMLIFEDGYKNTIEYAYPILKRYRIPALIFLVVNFIGDVNRWDNSKYPILSIEDIAQLNKTDMISFGLQSKTNRDLTNLSDDELYDEIIRSKLLLEEIVSYRVQFFNYPKDKFNYKIKNYLSYAGIPIAFINKPGQVTSLQDFHSIPTIKLSQADNWLRLFGKIRKLEG